MTAKKRAKKPTLAEAIVTLSGELRRLRAAVMALTAATEHPPMLVTSDPPKLELRDVVAVRGQLRRVTDFDVTPRGET